MSRISISSALLDSAIEAFADYKIRLELFLNWIALRKYNILLQAEVRRIIGARDNGQYKRLGSTDFPTVTEILAALDTREFYDIEWEHVKLEAAAQKVIAIIKKDDFLSDFHQLTENQKLELMEEWASHLTHSQTGKTFFHECFEFDETSSNQSRLPPLFSFREMEGQLENFENKVNLGTGFIVGTSLRVTKLIHILLPEAYKSYRINITRADYLAGRYMSIFLETDNLVFDRLPKNFSDFSSTINYEQYKQVLETEFRASRREVTIKNTFREDLGLWLPYFQMAFGVVQFAINLKKYRDAPDNWRNKLELLANINGMIASYASFHKNYIDRVKETAAGIIPKERLFYKIGDFASKVNIIYDTASLCNDFKITAEAILDDDNRGAVRGGISIAGTAVGITIGFIGVSLGVGIVVGLSFALAGIFVPGLVNSRIKNRLLTWLEWSSFGKNRTRNLPATAIADPTDVRFEWTNDNDEVQAHRELRALYSLLIPADITFIRNYLSDRRVEVEFTITNFSIPPINHYVLVRFFRDNPVGREITNIHYLIPLDFYQSGRLPSQAWKQQSENQWFKKQELELEYQDENNRTTVKGIKHYKLQLILPRQAEISHRYVQFQFIPLPPDYDFTSTLSTAALIEITNNVKIPSFSKRTILT